MVHLAGTEPIAVHPRGYTDSQIASFAGPDQVTVVSQAPQLYVVPGKRTTAVSEHVYHNTITTRKDIKIRWKCVLLTFIVILLICVIIGVIVWSLGRKGEDEKKVKCEDNWRGIEDGCYLYVPRYSTWHDAEAECNRIGGHLASIHSDKETEDIGNYLKHVSGGNVWIGGYLSSSNQLGVDNSGWTDRTPMDYHRWESGNTSPRGGDCVSLSNPVFHGSPYTGYPYSVWNRSSCANKYTFLCKK